MEVLGIRYVSVSDGAQELAAFFDSLGLPRRPLDSAVTAGFAGAIFPAGSSWIEIWNDGPQMPAGHMLQIVVDDADAFAEHARTHGLAPQGPMDVHGERVYYLPAPGGLQLSFQSVLR